MGPMWCKCILKFLFLAAVCKGSLGASVCRSAAVASSTWGLTIFLSQNDIGVSVLWL